MRKAADARGIFIALLTLVATTSAAAADDIDVAAKDDTATNLIVTIGTSVDYGPKFPGSRYDGFSVTPSFDFRRIDEPEENSAADDNIDYGLIDAGGFELGPVAGFRDGRSRSDDGGLKGLHSVHWDIDAGAFVNYWAVPNLLRLRSEIRQAISNGTGLMVDTGIDWFQPLSEKWLLSAGSRIAFASGDYMRKYFGVSSMEAMRNGALPAFKADAGLKSTGFVASAAYDVTPTLTVQLYDRFDRLGGDAADSPITSMLGSKSQNVIGISLTKAFSVSF